MNVIDWLLDGDPSVKYLVTRDLLGHDDPELRSAIGLTGWCREYIRNRNADGGWGRRFYQPKWICSHYTLCELRKLEYPGDPVLLSEINRIGIEEAAPDGGINPAVSIETSDACVTAMYLDYAVFFGADSGIIRRIVDYLFSMRMPDGGFNCNLNQTAGAVHSSLHTSVCVLEAWTAYAALGNEYRIDEIRMSMQEIAGFILEHRLYRSSRSGEIIDKKMLMMTYPFRWKYNVLRGLNALASSGIPYDSRMEDALALLERKRLPDGRWKSQANIPGQVFFTMEEPGKPGRMVTYLGLKILKIYGASDSSKTSMLNPIARRK